MLPLIENDLVLKYHWIDYSVFLNMLALSQVTPGPIAINSATFVGYILKGVPGATVATLGVVLVSLILISIVYRFSQKFKDSKTLKSMLLGMRPLVIGLIFAAFLSLGKITYIDEGSIEVFIIALISGFLILIKNTNPIIVIFLAALLGMFIN